jgi:GGDEF domain-containing protein
VLFLDLDFFKRVNDTHGHLAGSQVLREVGAILARQSGSRGGVAARYGGDEFVLVLPGLDLDAAVDLAEEIRLEIVTSTFCAGRGDVHPDPLHLKGLTCSIGVATLHRHLSRRPHRRRVPLDAAAAGRRGDVRGQGDRAQPDGDGRGAGAAAAGGGDGGGGRGGGGAGRGRER